MDMGFVGIPAGLRSTQTRLQKVNGSRPASFRPMRRTIVNVADPISPTDNGVYTVDDRGDKEEAFRLWAKCARELPVQGAVQVRDELDDLESTQCVVLKERGRVIAAGRLIREGYNVRLSKVAVAPSERGKGYGKRLVQAMLSMALSTEGVVYIRAHRWEFGFYSLLGFSAQGGEEYEELPEPLPKSKQAKSSKQFSGFDDFMHDQSQGAPLRTMIYQFEEEFSPKDHQISLKTSDIERALGFYGAVGFTATEKYFIQGRRACKLCGFGLSLELEEKGLPGDGSRNNTGAPQAHFAALTIDVTKTCTDLPAYLNHLNRKHGGGLLIGKHSTNAFRGRRVMSSAVVLDPDGFPIQFERMEGTLPDQMVKEMGW